MSFTKIGRWNSGVKLSYTKKGLPSIRIQEHVLMQVDHFTSPTQKIDILYNKSSNTIAIVPGGTELKCFRIVNKQYQICTTRLSSVLKRGSSTTPTNYTIDTVNGQKAIFIQIPETMKV